MGRGPPPLPALLARGLATVMVWAVTLLALTALACVCGCLALAMRLTAVERLVDERHKRGTPLDRR
jgi:hypothetical protein